VGDFGLATSSIAAIDPSDVAPRVAARDTDMTLGALAAFLVTFYIYSVFSEVGTTLYIAPEVQSRKRGPTNHTKADIYSLGVSRYPH
jgi:translation initiation factor 2-alpha kinase 4